MHCWIVSCVLKRIAAKHFYKSEQLCVLDVSYYLWESLLFQQIKKLACKLHKEK